mgnify:CR=1 FL=1
MVYFLWALLALIVCYLIYKFVIYICPKRSKVSNKKHMYDMDEIMARRGNRSRIRYPYDQKQNNNAVWNCCDDGDD